MLWLVQESIAHYLIIITLSNELFMSTLRYIIILSPEGIIYRQYYSCLHRPCKILTALPQNHHTMLLCKQHACSPKQ